MAEVAVGASVAERRHSWRRPPVWPDVRLFHPCEDRMTRVGLRVEFLLLVLYTWAIGRSERFDVTVGDSWCQWHLNNEGQRKGADGEDINVEDAWATTRGSGVNVAVVDDGMQYEHPDLTDNVNRLRNHNYSGGRNIYDPAESHGTQVAGVIAALDNSIGMRGVAPQAKIYGYNYLLNQSVMNEADAMIRHMSDTAVSNNSWGPPDNPLPHRATDLWERRVDSGVADGFGSKGVFYVFAAGNGADDGDYSTLDEYANYYAVTAACAVNDLGRRTSYSESGANLWVCAPSSDFAQARAGIATTTNFERYTSSFGGTSAAAPQVSGVAALVRAVNSGLSWRDVKLILAASARKNDPDNTGWLTAALKYGSDPSDPEYYGVQPRVRLRGGGRQGGRGSGQQLAEAARDAEDRAGRIHPAGDDPHQRQQGLQHDRGRLRRRLRRVHRGQRHVQRSRLQRPEGGAGVAEGKSLGAVGARVEKLPVPARVRHHEGLPAHRQLPFRVGPAPGRGPVWNLDPADGGRPPVGRADQQAGFVEHHRLRAQVHARGARIGIRGPRPELLDRGLGGSQRHGHGHVGYHRLRRAPHPQQRLQQGEGERLCVDLDPGCRSGRFA